MTPAEREAAALAFDWHVYERGNRAANDLYNDLEECPSCAGFFAPEFMPRHKGRCALLCQKCGDALTALGSGAHAECISEVETVDGKRVEYVTFQSRRAVA